jgi:putative sterol carrier protein
MPTVRETFEAMPGRFRSDRAQGLTAVIQYDISGEGGGTYHVEIAEGRCTLREGPASAPTLTVSLSAPDWLDMLAGKLSGQVAFMSGRLRHKGDMSLLMRLPGLFGV